LNLLSQRHHKEALTLAWVFPNFGDPKTIQNPWGPWVVPSPSQETKKDLTWVKEVTTCLPQLINV
jgi:hypothetical protein